MNSPEYLIGFAKEILARNVKPEIKVFERGMIENALKYELPLAMHAIAMGGHVRIGFEDNIYYHKGVLAKSNAQLAARIVRIAKRNGT